MNLPELLKIAGDAMRCEWATEEWAREHFGDDQEAKFVATFSPAEVASILKRLQEAEKDVARWRMAEKMYCGFDFDYRLDEDSPSKPVLLLRLPDGVGAGAALRLAIDAAMNGGKE